MHIGRFRLGMRTFKSALSVLICILIFEFFNRGEPWIAALAAVFSLRQDLTTTFSFGKSRILGNTIGGIGGILYLLLQQRFHESFLVEIIALPALVALVIILSDGINNNAGIISAIATILLITLSVDPGDSVGVAVDRIFDTFIGTAVAIGINFILRPPEPEVEEELKEDLAVLKTKEAELQQQLQEIQTKIKNHEK
ncbi:FUSC family protein [Enterococcus saccharolyticus]|uniref:Integral membrane bound transporter domain-containing protein n=1 Tax=Enterococcus saccharolyticus subsp. saccharolyticus ATCC 43076 TaxID=1139996 RepID=S0NWM1_9ENTE|nr:FUSC family protein [Enterococcus saccharolyticus]EOT29703.1 hypothetical protein OMQ_01016 [Enterococcus saccharolyticus subsp. saccharolyticus ATCC 43076]EOT80863.1 hypothetical protein I572_01395 [Enterococcus saccharolyticus subsp. saccharolyticus ATCC 43076]